jgi:integrase
VGLASVRTANQALTATAKQEFATVATTKPTYTQADLEAFEAPIVGGIPKTKLLKVSDGPSSGLRVQVTPGRVQADGTYSTSKSWIFRYSLYGIERRAGLGSFDSLDLDHARALAIAMQDKVDHGIDPIEDKQQQREERVQKAKGRKVTFRVAAEEYIKVHSPEWKSAAYLAQWKYTLSHYVYPVIGDVPMGKLDRAMVLKVLEPHWLTSTPTMRKIRDRIQRVVVYAVAKKYRPRGLEDPTVWKDGLKPLLADPKKFAKTKNHPALPYARMPEFMTRLKQDDRVAAWALQFAILTAVRSDEARLAVWSEVNLSARTWTIPESRKKEQRELLVPLSEAAIALLVALKPQSCKPSDLVFRGAVGEKSLLRAARRAAATMDPPVAATDLTTHGMRSAFRTWGGEETWIRREILEFALAHKVGGATENSYNHGTLLAKRARAMEAWSQYCNGSKPDRSNVTALKRSA